MQAMAAHGQDRLLRLLLPLPLRHLLSFQPFFQVHLHDGLRLHLPSERIVGCCLSHLAEHVAIARIVGSHHAVDVREWIIT